MRPQSAHQQARRPDGLRGMGLTPALCFQEEESITTVNRWSGGRGQQGRPPRFFLDLEWPGHVCKSPGPWLVLHNFQLYLRKQHR